MDNTPSPEFKELVRKAELFGLYKNTQLQEAHRKILASANSDKRLLNTKEINILCEKSHCNPEKLEELQRKLPQLINEAKETLIRKIPDITKPGGSLYPKERAEACWRDCFHLARISIYGTAAANTNITDKQGLQAVQKKNKKLKVPIDASTRRHKEQ